MKMVAFGELTVGIFHIPDVKQITNEGDCIALLPSTGKSNSSPEYV